MDSDDQLDGTDSGMFVVVNVNARLTGSGLTVCETISGETVFATADKARETCAEMRGEFENEEIYVYKLVAPKRA